MHRSLRYPGAFDEAQRSQILLNHCDGFAIFFQKNGLTGAAAKGFDPYRAGAGIGIDKNGSFDPTRQDVEEGFAEAIGRGAGLVARDWFQPARAKFSCDDPHQPTCTSPYCRCQWSRMYAT